MAKVIQPNMDVLEKNRRRAYLRKHDIDPDQPVQLNMAFPALSHTDVSFLPNDLARSALFTARNKTAPRRTMVQSPIFHLHNSVTLYYTGIELRVYDDLLIWQQILRYARAFPLGEPIFVKIKDLVADVGWSKSGPRYETVRECISRLKATEILLLNEKSYGRSPSLSLIDRYVIQGDDRGKPSAYQICLDPEMVTLFANSTFTNHDWPIYRDLSPCGSKLADYINSHRVPNPLPVPQFLAMCDSADINPRSAMQTVRKACKEMELQKIAAKCWVKNGMIYTIRWSREKEKAITA